MAAPLVAAVARPLLSQLAKTLGRELMQELREEVADELVKEVKASVQQLQLNVRVELDLSNLQRLKGKARQAVFRAVNRSAKPVREAVVANAEKIKRFGHLARSIGTKTRMYPGGIITVIGPKMSFLRKEKKKKTRGPESGQKGNIRPYLYAWLLEYGTKRSKAKPFLKPAWDAKGGDYRARVIDEIAAELAKVNGAESPSAT